MHRYSIRVHDDDDDDDDAYMDYLRRATTDSLSHYPCGRRDRPYECTVLKKIRSRRGGKICSGGRVQREGETGADMEGTCYTTLATLEPVADARTYPRFRPCPADSTVAPTGKSSRRKMGVRERIPSRPGTSYEPTVVRTGKQGQPCIHHRERDERPVGSHRTNDTR